MRKQVICIEGVPKFLPQMQRYEVLAENDKFYLVRYHSTWKGWWKKSRFEDIPEGVTND